MRHNYHILEPSPWPFWASFCVFFFVLSFAFFMNSTAFSEYFVLGGGLMILSSMVLWWSDVIKEAIVDDAHNSVVRRGLGLGIMMFILSEIMFFFPFFWSFFSAWLSPLQVFLNWERLSNTWPPEGIEVLDSWKIPYINTLLLLLSGTTVTWAHHEIINGNQQKAAKALFITVLLGAVFLVLQVVEYYHTEFSFREEGFKAIYASNFYMITGLHGFHVLVGLIFLSVCLVRLLKGHFAFGRNHIGLEFAAWYWHFVDVVWIFLFIFLYWFSSSS